MFDEASELCFAQDDGGLPTTLGAGSAPGESGVSVLSALFQGGMHFSAKPRRHHIFFQVSEQAHFECRIADRTLSHEAQAGSLAICPTGADYFADASASVEAIVVAIDPGRLALAAAEGSALDAQLIERFTGYDQPLLDLARNLASETAKGYPNGPLFWNEIASTFLAEIAGRSEFHFTRVFARSVGVTPHRYVVHQRLRRAVELLRDGRSGLAEAAASTGFADQSHLSRWVRRGHGVSPTQLAA